MLARCWCRLCDFMRLQWRTYRALFCWLLVWLVVGAVLGIVTIVIGNVAVDQINYHLIDGNILNATSLSPSMGGFVWQRILSLIVPMIVVFVMAWLSRVTALIIFPVVLMHGYWLSVAIWWVFFYYSLPAILVIIFYTVWLLLVTAILFVGLVWALQWGNDCRCLVGGRPWGAMIRGISIMIVVAVVFGLLEYMVFCTVLGKIVYKGL